MSAVEPRSPNKTRTSCSLEPSALHFLAWRMKYLANMNYPHFSLNWHLTKNSVTCSLWKYHEGTLTKAVSKNHFSHCSFGNKEWFIGLTALVFLWTVTLEKPLSLSKAQEKERLTVVPQETLVGWSERAAGPVVTQTHSTVTLTDTDPSACRTVRPA